MPTDPPAYRQRLRRPLRSIRRRHQDGRGSRPIPPIALPRGRRGRRGRRWHRGRGPGRGVAATPGRPGGRESGPAHPIGAGRGDHPRHAGRVRRRRPGRGGQPRRRPPALAGRGRIEAGARAWRRWGGRPSRPAGRPGPCSRSSTRRPGPGSNRPPPMRFFGPSPALMVVEPESLCWITGRMAGARDGATWAGEFARLPALRGRGPRRRHRPG